LDDVDKSILNKLILEAVKRAKNKRKRMQRCRQNRTNSGPQQEETSVASS